METVEFSASVFPLNSFRYSSFAFFSCFVFVGNCFNFSKIFSLASFVNLEFWERDSRKKKELPFKHETMTIKVSSYSFGANVRSDKIQDVEEQQYKETTRVVMCGGVEKRGTVRILFVLTDNPFP